MTETKKYNELSMEKLDKILVELIPETNPGDKYYIGPVGNGLYQIGEGVFTRIEGYRQFNEALRVRITEMFGESTIDPEGNGVIQQIQNIHNEENV